MIQTSMKPMIRTELEEYVKQYLPIALKSIIETSKINELPNLTIYEKAIIFAYTDATINQHQKLNEQLWASEGEEMSDFGYYLERTLSKLDAYKGLVFRGARSTYCDVERYKKASKDKTFVTEYHFLSASKLQITAQGFGNILFRIYAKNAKEIEYVSKHRKEQEILFQKCTTFKVVYVSDNGFSTIITLKEI